MSLRSRVVAAVALVLFVSAAVGVALAGWQAKLDLQEEFTAALLGGRQTAQSAFENLPRSAHPDRDLRQLVATFDGNRHVAAQLYGANGETLAASRPEREEPAPAWFAALLRPPVDAVILRPPAPGYSDLRLEPVFANDIAADWMEFLDLALVLTASFMVGAILIWLTVGRALRPLLNFSAALLRIGSGEYDTTVREQGPLELVRLGRSVNEMARRLGAMHAKNRLLEDQLRTLQDEERADLARDLHDEIGPHLFAVNVDAAMVGSLLGEGRTGEALDQVAAIQRSVAHMQSLVRDILGRLRPIELIELGLNAAIEELVGFWRGRQPLIDFNERLPGEQIAMPALARETLYRVVQEGINNAVRHARPSRIDIEVAAEADGGLMARVSDNGRGAAPPNPLGRGLIGMRERVEAAGGRLTIERTGGWAVTARLPAAVDPAAEATVGAAVEAAA